MLLDVNVLLALSWDQHVHHEAAHRRFAEVESWHTTPITEAGLVRLLLTEAVVGRRVTGQEALTQLRGLRTVAGWGWLPDDSSLAEGAVNDTILIGRRQVTDLHLVNLAATNQTRLATFDSGIRDWLVPADRHLVDIWST